MTSIMTDKMALAEAIKLLQGVEQQADDERPSVVVEQTWQSSVSQHTTLLAVVAFSGGFLGGCAALLGCWLLFH